MSISYNSTYLSNKIPVDSIAKLRLERDLKEIHLNDGNSPIIFASPVDDNLFHIEACFLGPESTPYENGIFVLDLKLSDQFPFVPPLSIIFKRATMQPNVDECGKFMSDLLTPKNWSPAMTIKNILEHICARFAVPDVDSNECDFARAHSYRTDKKQFEIIAREYSIKYAAAT